MLLNPPPELLNMKQPTAQIYSLSQKVTSQPLLEKDDTLKRFMKRGSKTVQKTLREREN